MLNMLKRLFLSRPTDEKVAAINEERRAILQDVSKVAKRHRDLLKKNGVALQIYIATGGDKHGH